MTTTPIQSADNGHQLLPACLRTLGQESWGKIVGYCAKHSSADVFLNAEGDRIMTNSTWGINDLRRKLGLRRDIVVVPVTAAELYGQLEQGVVYRYRVGKLRFGELSPRAFYDMFFRHMECDEHIHKGLFRLRWNPELEPRLQNLERYSCT